MQISSNFDFQLKKGGLVVKVYVAFLIFLFCKKL